MSLFDTAMELFKASAIPQVKGSYGIQFESEGAATNIFMVVSPFFIA